MESQLFAPVPCIIDTDPGVDDVLAILLALASRELLVLAIVLVHGNASSQSCLINLRKMFYALERHLEAHPGELERWPGLDLKLRKKLGAGPIMVVMGPSAPLEGEAVTAKYFHGLDGLSNIDLRHDDLTPPADYDHNQSFYTLSDEPITTALPALMQQYPASSIAYLAIGPLTALAQLHLLSPESSILHHFAVIFVMGGSLDFGGNTTPVAEFNIYADPYAAQVIFKLRLPHLHILPLDITTGHTLPFSLYESLVDMTFQNTSRPSQPNGKSPLVHFTSSFLEYTREKMLSFGADVMELHDPTAIWALIDWSRGGAGAKDSADDVIREMRKRIEQDGFTRSVVERRRSVDLALRARFEREREASQDRLGSVVELSPALSGNDGYTGAEADEQGGHTTELANDDEGSYGGWYDDERLAPGWEWQWRDFEVETTGVLTRGMMVVDRRQTATLAVQASGRNANRAIAAEEPPEGVDPLESMPKSGSKVVVATPGEDTLRTLLLERLWKVVVGLP